MNGIGKILAPVDFSSPSEVSCRYAVEVARTFEAEVIFLHVIPEHSLSSQLLFPEKPLLEEGEEPNRKEEEKTLSRLDAFLAPIPLEDVRHTKRVVKGVPFVRILQAVETLLPDLVIQGTHGTTGLEQAVIGGTADRIIRKARCPVVSIKPAEFGSFLGKVLDGLGIFEGSRSRRANLRDAYRFPPERILYPTDFSEPSKLAMTIAGSFAREAAAELLVLHAAEEGEGRAVAGAVDEETGEVLSAAEQMENVLMELNALYTGLKITPRIVADRPTSAILAATVDEEVDLVIMGTHGRSGWGLMTTGSNVDRVIRNAPCPVLTVRPNWKMEEVERRFRKVFRKLSPADLQRISQENQALIDGDLLGSPTGMKTSDLFLRYYSREGLEKAMEMYGIFDLLRRKGFDDFLIDFEVEDPYRQKVRLYAGGEKRPENLLIDLIMREGILHPCRGLPSDPDDGSTQFSVLTIEWLCMQNPLASFAPERPPLPGQTHPGLGIGYEMQEFMVLMGKRLRKDGLVNHPQHYHNAKLYHGKFRFYDPVEEGRLIALIRDTGDQNLADVSWAVHHGCLQDRKNGEPVTWQGGTQVYPLAEGLETYFLSDAYHDAVWETVGNTHYRIDWELFRRRMKDERKAEDA